MLRPSVFFFPFNSAPKMPKARLISSRKETWKIILEDLISHSPKTNEQLEKPLKVWRYICPKKMTQLHQWNPQSIILTCRIWVSNTFWSSTSEISCHNTCRKCDIFWGKQMRLCVGQGWIGGLRTSQMLLSHFEGWHHHYSHTLAIYYLFGILIKKLCFRALLLKLSKQDSTDVWERITETKPIEKWQFGGSKDYARWNVKKKRKSFINIPRKKILCSWNKTRML